jgi:hypothetical protein
MCASDEAGFWTGQKDDGCAATRGVYRSASSCSSQVCLWVLLIVCGAMGPARAALRPSSLRFLQLSTRWATARVRPVRSSTDSFSMLPLQTMMEACSQSQGRSSSSHSRRCAGALNAEDSNDGFYASSLDLEGFSAPEPARLSLEAQREQDEAFPSRYQACVSMIRCGWGHE